MEYRVDVRDLKFQLFEWLPTRDLLASGHFGAWDEESLEMAVDEAVRIARETLAPTNEQGDRVGARLEDGRVSVPPSFVDAYRTLAEAGWVGSVTNPDLGGMGMPHVAGTVANELFAGASLSLSLVLLLTRGVGEIIETHGSDELRGLFCEKLYSGRWTGTMCLTEPQAGSDIGASTARAEPLDNGRYLVSGEKIFITFGDHDLTDNIVHAVLARLPGAPAGTRGLSLFIIPKLRVGEDGAAGEANDVVCASIEHKLGIHGSPTCSVLFGPSGACEGWLLGEPNRGMRVMFELMNSARIEVGLQGMAVAAAAHQAALAYARERVQSRPWDRARDPDAEPVAIVRHPDVRRMLWTSSAYVQAMRALLLETSLCVDLAQTADSEDERRRYASRVDLLTPVCKAWASDWGFRVTEWSLQVYGGYGYVREYPAEQYLRDAKIASIYEGTNGIQALDFVGRKVPRDGGRVFGELLAAVIQTARELGDDPQLGGPAALLTEAADTVREVASQVPEREDGALLMMLNAVPFLDMTGHLLGARLLLEQARLARQRLTEIPATSGAEPDARFYSDKILAASTFAYRALPQIGAQAIAILEGDRAPIEASF